MQVFLSNSQVSSIRSLKLSCINNDRYIANASMEGHAFANADGDFLIVPQQGSKLLTIITFLFLC
jgi:homogentisate 1,2-dioxygenase